MADEDTSSPSASSIAATGSSSARRLNPSGERPRSSIAVPILAVILVIAAFAMAFAALRSSSKIWYGALYTFTTFLLLTAVLAARFRRGYERAFWFGFAVFGWGFFLLGYRPWMNAFEDVDEVGNTTLNSNLLTSRVILFLLPHLRRTTDDLGAIHDITQTTIGIAHLLMTLVVAITGGLIAMLFRRGSRQRISARSLAVLAGLVLVGSIATSVYSERAAIPFFPEAFGRESWYSKYLAAMNEDSLRALSRRHPNATIYRLLWLPTFHHPVSVRIERAGEGARLYGKVLDGKGGYDPGQLAIDRSLTLDAQRWNRLEQLLDESAYWELPTRLADDGGCDGDQLIVEGVRAGKYHVVDRWDPDPIYKELCHYMLGLTGIEMSEQWHAYHSGDSDHPG
jgi:hypothetical protein